MPIYKFTSVLFIFLLIACEGTDLVSIEEEPSIEECSSGIIATGKYYQKDDKQFLYGGEDSTTHFNITDWELNPCYLGNGAGRESFPALIKPEYVPLEEVKDRYPDSMDALILQASPYVKVYPFRILRRHELINDVVNGVPVMAVYCYLADLVAVYERTYCNDVLTFGVSGFTYKDPNAFDGLESFILWDRNSESLWWPINDEGVSGMYKDSRLKKYDFRLWGRTTMEEVKNTYPDAVVIAEGQTVDLPVSVFHSEGCN